MRGGASIDPHPRMPDESDAGRTALAPLMTRPYDRSPTRAEWWEVPDVGSSKLSPEMGETPNNPEDWTYLEYPNDDRRDYRWAGFWPLPLIRGLLTWITGRDPLAERRRQELARQQAANHARMEEREKDAYGHLNGPTSDHSDH